MKGKLIKTKEGYYLVDNSEILEDHYYLAWENYYSSPRWVRYVLSIGLNGDKQFNIIASDINLDDVKKLSKENCDEIFGVVDVEKLADDSSQEFLIKPIESPIFTFGYEEGFEKAMELNKDKVFTLEDIRKAYQQGEEDSYLKGGLTKTKEDNYIQSLQQPTEIEVEVEQTLVQSSIDGEAIWKYKLDENSCLILNKK